MKTINKLISSTLLLILGTVQGAWAQTTVTTKDELFEAVKSDQTVTLDADITLPNNGGRLDIDGKTVILNLNGHTLKRDMQAVDAGGQVIAIMNGGKLTITDKADNSGKITGGWAFQGGGIYVYLGCSLTISCGTITGNRADQIGSGGYGYGGGVENHGTMTMTGGVISGNTAGQYGGGIYAADDGTLTQNGGVISGNTAGMFGGGIYNLGNATSYGAKITNNSAGFYGGGLYTENDIVIDCVTITGNSAMGGGGIFMDANGHTVKLQGECTITGNTANVAGGGVYQENGTLAVQNKLVVKDNNYDDLYQKQYQLVTVTGPLADGASIGISTTSTPFTTGYSAFNDAAPATYFFFSSTTTGGNIVWSGGEASIQTTGYKYVERAWDETNKKVTETVKTCENYRAINDNSEGWYGLTDGWYVVTGNSTYKAISVLGEDVHLIIPNDMTLTTSHVKLEPGHTLHIYNQPAGVNPQGKLKADNSNSDLNKAAGIGGGNGTQMGNLIVHGGTIIAKGNEYAAGIGSGSTPDGSVGAGSITVYSGDIEGYGGKEAAGIGGGSYGSGGIFTIYNGYVRAFGAYDAAGIGGGFYGDGGTTEIHGGKVEATTSGGGAGIGSGSGMKTIGYKDCWFGSITITGGEVIANSYEGSAIGGGCYSGYGFITISGGIVNAISQKAVGIGSGNDEGNGSAGRSGHNGEGKITISGGIVTAACEANTFCAIGGGAWAPLIPLEITGGTIYAHTGNAAGWAAIGNRENPLAAIYKDATVFYHDSDTETYSRAQAGDRLEACKNLYVIIQPCDHLLNGVPNFTTTSLTHIYNCTYCANTNVEKAHEWDEDRYCAICHYGPVLYDQQKNAAFVDGIEGQKTTALIGRTLYKDGSWNTLCLPFDFNIPQTNEENPFYGAKVMKLKNANIENNTLTLNFENATETTFDGKRYTILNAGTPYLIKWEADTENPEIVAPEFANITFSGTEPTNTTIDGVISFCGSYDPVVINGEDKTMLYLGANNKLFYPNAAMTIGAFRAYFKLADGITMGEPTSAGVKGISNFVLKFDDGETTGLESLYEDLGKGGADSGWYDLQGRRLSGQPTHQGIYINNGKKFIIK